VNHVSVRVASCIVHPLEGCHRNLQFVLISVIVSPIRLDDCQCSVGMALVRRSRELRKWLLWCWRDSKGLLVGRQVAPFGRPCRNKWSSWELRKPIKGVTSCAECWGGAGSQRQQRKLRRRLLAGLSGKRCVWQGKLVIYVIVRCIGRLVSRRRSWQRLLLIYHIATCHILFGELLVDGR